MRLVHVHAVSLRTLPVSRLLTPGSANATPLSIASRSLLFAHVLVLLLLLSSCSSDDSGGSPAGNPAPSITSLAPLNSIAGGAAFTLTITGANFQPASVVQWNGDNRPTTFLSATQLAASISAADIASAGTARVAVVTPGGGTSHLASFAISLGAPAISSLSPSTISAGSAPFTLAVSGANFTPTSVIRWNGTDRATAFVNSTQLTATIAASDIAAPQAAQVTVMNPVVGGTISAAASFTVSTAQSSPVPMISSLSPAPLTAELTGLALTVNATGLVAGSVAQWNGADRVTIVTSSTQLLFAPLPADNAFPGNAVVTVTNPAPGGGISGSLGVTVRALAPNAVGVTDRISVAADSTEANGDSSAGAISADGRFIAFSSTATNLVPGTTGGSQQVLLRDTCRGAPAGCTPTVSSISVAGDGSPGNAASYSPRVSADGRYVAFTSSATNLVSGDANEFYDVFLRDTCFGASGCTPSTILVSVASDGSQGNRGASGPAVSGNGRFVAFTSAATNLVAGDTNDSEDLFVRDTCAGAGNCTPSTIRVSVANDGSQSNDRSSSPSISTDGRLVAFVSSATNLVSQDTNAYEDVFVRDTCIGASGCTASTIAVSVDPAGAPANSSSFLPRISGNGRHVVFTSWASNLVTGDTNGGHDVFVRDTCIGAPAGCTASNLRISVGNNGAQADANSGGPATGGAVISADGRRIAFGSRATNLVTGDTNGDFDIFLRDTCAGASGCAPATVLLSVASEGTGSLSNGRSDAPDISGDGRFVVFQSTSTTFLPGDTNSYIDVFVARTGAP